MSQKAPGKHFREGISLMKLIEMFPDEQSAVDWFEAVHWPDGRKCGHCGSDNTKKASHKTMPYWCSNCRSYFSVKTGTCLEKSRLPLRKWVFAVYLYVTNLKGVSSMRLHRDLNVTQKTAWFMLHRLRLAWNISGLEKMIGPAEVDETYMGGKRKNMSNAKRKTLTGRGAVGKTAVAGIKDRESNRVVAKVVESTDKPTLQGFIKDNVEPGSDLYTDEHGSYEGIEGYNHDSVIHSTSQYVKGTVHTNGVESFWSMFKRAHKGTYHKMSPKHLQRYVDEFAGRHGVRCNDTIDQMGNVVAMMVGKQLSYEMLIADNGLDNGAR